MKIDFKSKIHNKYRIEVKNIKTDEIEQIGYAENIVLSNLLTSTNYMGVSNGIKWVGKAIRFGDGDGEISPDRTTLFNLVGAKASSLVEFKYDEALRSAISVKKCVLLPTEYLGKTITEVGVADNIGGDVIYTHALIKDSEGNPLILGPKTDIQEITIYSTIYFQIEMEEGVTLLGDLNSLTKTGNALLLAGAMVSEALIRESGNLYYGRILINDSPLNGSQGVGFTSQIGNKLSIPKLRLETNQFNNIKIKSIRHGTSHQDNACTQTIKFDLEILAENSSTTWSGHEFKNLLIATGDGVTTEFSLTWNEAWLSKPRKIYVDGVEVTSGVTWSVDKITFDTAPVDGLSISADYWVRYLPKDINHVVDVEFSITLNEGVAP